MGSFLGYRRADGRVGVRNHVVVFNVAGEIGPLVRRLGEAAPGVVPVVHPHGYAQFPEDREQTLRALAGNAANPNVAAALFIGLGDERDFAEEAAERARALGQRAAALTVRGEGGAGALFARAVEWLKEALAEAEGVPRVTASTAELIVGLECGGSDGWSGITANPALGVASDLIVADGGTVILSETTEAIGAEHILAARAVSKKVAEEFLALIEAYETRMKAEGSDYRKGNPSPGNIRGGLTTLDEKSLGCIKKAGSTPLTEVIAYAERPTQKGFVFMDSPGYDVDSVTGMVAGGAQVVVFTTGRGSPTGSPIAPVIKVGTNSRLYERMPEHIDVNAGVILDGKGTLASVGEEIYRVIHETASGKKCASERHGHAEFAIWRLAESV